MTYTIRLISIFHFLTAFFGTLIGIGYFISEVLEIEDSFLVYVLVIVLFFVCYKLAIKLSYGTAQITLTKEGIEFKWIKKPLLRFQQNIRLDYADIDGWKFRQEYQYNYFKIYSKKPSIGFERFPEWHPTKDEFYKFMGAFSKRIKQVNKKRKVQSTKKSDSGEKHESHLIVDREEEFHKSYWSKVLLIIYIAFLVLGIYYIFDNLSKPKSNILMVMAGIMACIFLVIKTIRRIRSNKN